MGILLSAEERAMRRRHAKIERALDKERKATRREIKILLLGAGESGKSTIVKQMKIIHMDGYSHDELLDFRAAIHRNVFESLLALVALVNRLELTFANPDSQTYAASILAAPNTPDFIQSFLDPSTAHQIQLIWNDPAAAAALERTEEYYIMDSAPYFLANVERIAEPEFVPTEEDVLRARIKTTGISETRFRMDHLRVHMFDVGGQRSERKKWIHCFENVTSVMFIVALSEYDQVLLEEQSQNRMAESLQLFESVASSRWFGRTSIILFLNKIDIFVHKIKRVPLVKYFPEYAGGDDFEKATKFFVWRFKQANRSGLHMYPHLTCATDTNQIRFVFLALKDTLLKNSFQDVVGFHLTTPPDVSNRIRLGSLRIGSYVFETPSAFVYTRRGHPLHLTPDIAPRLPLHICWNHMMEETLTNVLNQWHGDLKQLLGHSDETPTYASTRDVLATVPTKVHANGTKFISVSTTQGIRKVTVEDYMGYVNKSGLDMVASLSDTVYECDVSMKRVRNSVDRTVAFLDTSLKLLHKDSATTLLGTVVGGTSLEERKRSAEETAKRDVGGFVIEGFGLHETLEERDAALESATSSLPEDKVRIMHGAKNLYEMIKAVELGVDVFDGGFPCTLVEKGIAMDVSKGLRLMNLWDEDMKQDTRPMIEGCECMACQNHTRAYVHHLLKTHEILSLILLMSHNIHQFDLFFKRMRESIQQERFIEFKQEFEPIN